MARGLLATVVLAATLTGCLHAAELARGPSASDGVPAARAVFDDAVGDASEPGPRGVVSALCPGCPLSGLVPRGEPASHLDLTTVRLIETASSLVLELDVARIGPGFPELDGASDGHRTARFEACLALAGGSTDRCAVADVVADGRAVEVQGSFWLYAPTCNEWSVCIFSVPATLDPGAPATLRFEVPKAYLLYDGAGPVVTAIGARSTVNRMNDVWPSWHTAASVDTPLLKYHRHGGGQGDFATVADEAGPFDARLALRATPAVPPARAEAAAVTLAPGSFGGRGSAYDRPELDLLAVDLRVEGGEVVARWTVAALPALPDHDALYFLDFGVKGKEVWEMGFLKEASGAYGYAGHCISYECAGDFGGDHEDHGMESHFSRLATARVVPGTPGVVEVRTPLGTFPSLAPGDETNLLTAEALYADASAWAGRYGDPARADWHKMSTVDERWGASPYVVPGP